MSYVPIIKRNDLSVYLMEIGENEVDSYLSSLTPAELIKYGALHHPEKQLEFAASRHLRTLLFGKKQIEYNEFGSPYIEGEGYISLSHTRGLVGLAHSVLFNVGLDLESVRDKAMHLHPKFIHPSEREFFDTTSAFDMSLLWSFKETLFKLADRRGVHFSKDLIIRKENDRFFGLINQYHILHEYELTYQLFGHYLITCNTCMEQIKSH